MRLVFLCRCAIRRKTSSHLNDFGSQPAHRIDRQMQLGVEPASGFPNCLNSSRSGAVGMLMDFMVGAVVEHGLGLMAADHRLFQFMNWAEISQCKQALINSASPDHPGWLPSLPVAGGAQSESHVDRSAGGRSLFPSVSASGDTVRRGGRGGIVSRLSHNAGAPSGSSTPAE